MIKKMKNLLIKEVKIISRKFNECTAEGNIYHVAPGSLRIHRAGAYATAGVA